MPATPYAKALTSINGAPNTSGGQIVAASATVQLSGENTTGWQSQRWEIYEYPDGFSAPAGWSTSNGVYFSTAVTPPVITLPAIALWGKFLFRLTVNGGLLAGVLAPVGSAQPLIDDTTAVEILSTKLFRDVAYLEGNQFDTVRQWIGDLKKVLRTIDSAGGGASSGTFASRPASGTTGQIYYTTDSKGAALWDGAAWRPIGPGGQLFTAPPLAGTWGWVNQNSSTIVQSGDALFLSHYADASAIGYQLATQAVPGATYTAEAWLQPLMLNLNCVGLAISDGTKFSGFMLQAGASSQALFVQHMNTFNSVSTTPYSSSNMGIPPTGYGLRLSNDGTKNRYSLSVDAGQTWRELFNENQHSFLTETTVGVFIAPFNNGQGPGTLIPHWKLTTP